MEQWQQDFTDEFYRVDEDGKRVYKLGILGIPRGNGKSPMAAGYGLFTLMADRDSPDVFCVAGSKDQAKIVRDFALSFVRGHTLEKWLKPSATIVHRETNGVMRCLAAEGSLLHGLMPSAVIGDELHALMQDNQVEVWNAMWTALHKRADPFAVGITTAGFNKDTLLGRMYDDALLFPDDPEDRLHVDGIPMLRIRRDLTNGTLFWWYGPPDEVELADILENEEIWRAVNPASWVTMKALRQQLNAPGFDPYDFIRLHCNAWTQARDQWIEPAIWIRGRSEDGIDKRARVTVAVDAALYHDTTAVAWAWKRSDKKIVLRKRVWSAKKENAHDILCAGGKIDLSLVTQFILDGIVHVYSVIELVYDPAFFDGEATILTQKGVTCAPMFQQGNSMREATQSFYQLVAEGRLLHHPGDKTLDRHIAATAAVRTERGWKLSKLNSSVPIDATTASVMAVWRADRQTSSVYADRDLLVLGVDEDDDE
jgi:phage terminase large subunit-like protein